MAEQLQRPTAGHQLLLHFPLSLPTAPSRLCPWFVLRLRRLLLRCQRSVVWASDQPPASLLSLPSPMQRDAGSYSLPASSVCGGWGTSGRVDHGPWTNAYGPASPPYSRLPDFCCLKEQHYSKEQQHLKRQHVTEQLQRTIAEHLHWTLSKQLQQQGSLKEQHYSKEQQHLKKQQHLTVQLQRTVAEHHQRTLSEQLQQQQQGSLDEH